MTTKCTLCNLCRYQNPVHGFGNEDADILIICDSFNIEELRYEKPFVGRAGDLIRKIISDIGLSVEDMYVTGMVSGTPPGNRMDHTLAQEALKVCPDEYLIKLIEKMNPKVIVLLGNNALNYFHGITGITDKTLKEKVMYWNGYPTLATPNPAYYFRHKLTMAWDLKTTLMKANQLAYVGEKPNLEVVKDFDKVISLINQIKKEKRFAVDTETTGLDVYQDTILGICIAMDWNNGYYIPLKERAIFGLELEPYWKDKQNIVESEFKSVIENEDIQMALHNANYDLRILESDLGIIGDGDIIDTMITNHLLNENEPKSLHQCSKKYPDIAGYDDEMERMRKKNKNLDMAEIPLDVLGYYGAGDAVVTLREAIRTTKLLKEIRV